MLFGQRITRIITNYFFVGQWVRFCAHPSAAGCERGRYPRSRPWVIRSGLTASASRVAFFSAGVWDTIWRFFTRTPSACDGMSWSLGGPGVAHIALTPAYFTGVARLALTPAYVLLPLRGIN